jgi:hypothetical protein
LEEEKKKKKWRFLAGFVGKFEAGEVGGNDRVYKNMANR